MTNGHDRLYISPSGLRSWHQWWCAGSSGPTSAIAAKMTSACGAAGRTLWEARRQPSNTRR
jgi:hypothetical protein